MTELFCSMMKQIKKVGEGVYGEVFRTKRGKNSVALKVSYNYTFKCCLYALFFTYKRKGRKIWFKRND